MKPASTFMPSLSFRMALIALLVAIIVAVPGLVAEANLVAMRSENERAGHASTALREYLALEAIGDVVERRARAGLLARPEAKAAALATIDAQLDRIDRSTDREITVIRRSTFTGAARGAMVSEEQRQEIAVRHLRGAFARIVAGDQAEAAAESWRVAVRQGIEGEQTEVRSAQVRAVAALERTQVAFLAATLLLVLAGLALIAWVRSNVFDPLQRLLVSTRHVAQREFAPRLPDRGPSEFRALNRSFNAMAEEIGRAQARLQDANRGLEREVSERTAELLAANASLRELDDRRRGFVATAGHELRTPIAVLRSDAEVALRDRAPTIDTLRASLERIVRTAGTLGRLIEDMLRVARADAPVLSYERETVELVALVEGTLAEFRPMIEADGGSTTLRGIDCALPVRVDPLRIVQVLRIIFDNAVKHCSREPCICVSFAREGGVARIEIGDCGDGIAADLLPHLFDRARWPRRRSEDGHGLGLTIAATIMEAHGGTVAVRVEAQAGTVITLELPCATLPGKDGSKHAGEGQACVC